MSFFFTILDVFLDYPGFTAWEDRTHFQNSYKLPSVLGSRFSLQHCIHCTPGTLFGFGLSTPFLPGVSTVISFLAHL